MDRNATRGHIDDAMAAFQNLEDADVFAVAPWDAPLPGATALHLAAWKRPRALPHDAPRWYRVFLEQLVERHGNVDFRNARGMTPLHLAASTGHVEMVEALLIGGASPTPSVRRPRARKPNEQTAQCTGPLFIWAGRLLYNRKGLLYTHKGIFISTRTFLYSHGLLLYSQVPFYIHMG